MALTKNTPRIIELGDYNDLLVEAGGLILQGAAVGVAASGFARELTTADTFAGFADGMANNRQGAAGDINVRTRKRGHVVLDVAGQLSVGAPVYALGNDQYSTAGSLKIGSIERVQQGGRAVVRFEIVDKGAAQVVNDAVTGQSVIVGPSGRIAVAEAKAIAPYFVHIGNSIAAQDNHYEYTAKQGNGIGVWIDALMQGAFEWLPTNVAGADINPAAPSVNFRNGVYGWGGGRLTGQIENSIPRLCEIISQVANGRKVYTLFIAYENDGGQGVTPDAFMASYVASVDKLIKVSTPILMLPLPSTGYDTAIKRQNTYEVRKRIALLYANNPNVIIVDGARDYYDPASSNFQPRAGMSDGTHPNKLGTVLIAKAVRDTLKDYVEVGYNLQSVVSPNSLAVGDAGVSGNSSVTLGAIPTSFSAQVFGAGQAMTVANSSDKLSYGKTLTVTASNSTTDGYGLYSQAAANVSAGDKVRLVTKFTIDSQADLLAPAPGTLRYGGSGNLLPSINFPSSDTSKIGEALVGETLVFKGTTVVIAAGNTALQMQALGVGRFPAGVTSGSNVTTVEFAAIEIKN